jgi:hypothetical protein
VTLAPDIRDTRRDPASSHKRSPAPRQARTPSVDSRPVEFWPTAAIRAALETDDLTVWQRIVVAIKRDPYGRTARQVEEVLETARPYGVSKALSEVLVRGSRSSPPASASLATISTRTSAARPPLRRR